MYGFRAMVKIAVAFLRSAPQIIKTTSQPLKVLKDKLKKEATFFKQKLYPYIQQTTL